MGDGERRRTQLAHAIADQMIDNIRHNGVETSGRFVEKYNVWL